MDNEGREKIAKAWEAEREAKKQAPLIELKEKSLALLKIMEKELPRMHRIGFSIAPIKDAMNDLQRLCK